MSGRQNLRVQLVLAVAELERDAYQVAPFGADGDEWRELSRDLEAISDHLFEADELATFHRTHDVTRVAVPPAWHAKGGAA